MATLQFKQAAVDPQVTTTANTDEWWDAHVNRPLAAVLVRALEPTGVTANQITLLSGLTGIGAGVCFGLASGFWPALGGLLLLATMILDCADGQLARLRGGGSFIGRMMDGYVDWLTAVSIHIGLWGYFFHHGFHLFGREIHSGLGTLLLALLAGASMALHSMIYDLYKNRLKALTGQGDVEVHQPAEIVERIRRATSWGERLYLRVYWLYCRSQASLLERSRDLGAQRVDPALAAIRHRYLGRGLRLWSGVGPTIRLTVFAFSAILAGYVWWGLYVYMLSGVVLANLYALWAARCVRRIEAEMALAIADLQ